MNPLGDSTFHHHEKWQKARIGIVLTLSRFDLGQKLSERDIAAAKNTQALFQSGCNFHQGFQALDREGRAIFEDLERGILETVFHENRLHLAFLTHVATLLPLADHVKRRLGDIKMAAGPQFSHLAIEEGHEQGADVRSIDVGIGHHHNLAIPPLGRILVIADPTANGGDDVAHLIVAQDFVQAGPLDIQDLASQWQNGLIETVAAAFSGPTCRITFDQEEFGTCQIVGGAVHQLAGQAHT